MNNLRYSIKLFNYNTKLYIYTVEFTYNQCLLDIIPDIRRLLSLDETFTLRFYNKFNQELPQNYKLRCNLELFLESIS